MVNTKILKEVLQHCNPHVESSTVEKIAPFFEYKNFNKGDVIVSNKGVCTTCYFIYSGVTRAYISNDGEEHTLWFGEKGDFITSFKTMYNNETGSEIIMALTNCETFSIEMSQFKQLIHEHIDVANIYIKILEAGYQYWEKRFIIHSQHNAENRFVEWMNRAEHLLPHLSLGVLAEYLNIDQSTLSRIRSKRK